MESWKSKERRKKLMERENDRRGICVTERTETELPRSVCDSHYAFFSFITVTKLKRKQKEWRQVWARVGYFKLFKIQWPSLLIELNSLYVSNILLLYN